MQLYKAFVAFWCGFVAVGCGGAPFTLEDAQSVGDGGTVQVTIPDTRTPVQVTVPGAQDAGQDAGTPVEQDAAPVERDAGKDVAPVAEDAGNDGAPVAEDANDGAPVERDAGIDAAPDAGTDTEVATCTPVPHTTFGCGQPIIVNLPEQYCILDLQSNGIAHSAVMPAKCLCDYTCECLRANQTNLCPSDESPKDCSIGTTGGVVVTCK